jgi:hypothetical protein
MVSAGLVLCNATCISDNADIVIILDSSGSMTEENYNKTLEFIISLIQNLDIGLTQTRVGFIYYGFRAVDLFFLNNYTTAGDMIAKIRTARYLDEETRTDKALIHARDTQFTPANGDRADRQNIALVITDGDTTLPIDTRRAANDAIKAGIRVLAVGINNDSASVDSEVRGITSPPKQRNVTYWYINNFDQLPLLRQNVSAAIGVCATSSGPPTFCRNTYTGVQCFCDVAECDRRPVNSSACVDVNECANNPCAAGLNCTNTLGSYTCDIPGAGPLSGAEVGVSSAGASTGTVIGASVLSAVVAILASVVVVFVAFKIKSYRTNKLAARSFVNMQGRLAHSDAISSSFGSVRSSESVGTQNSSDAVIESA